MSASASVDVSMVTEAATAPPATALQIDEAAKILDRRAIGELSSFK